MNDPKLLELREDITLLDTRTAEILQQLDQGTQGDNDLIWKQIRAIIAQRMRLVESERRRLVLLQQVITSEQAMLLITRLYHAVAKHVTDQATRTAIADELNSLTNQEFHGTIPREEMLIETAEEYGIDPEELAAEVERHNSGDRRMAIR